MPLDQITAKAKADKQHIVLGEGIDPRIIEGATRAARDGIARITLLGNPEDIHPQITAFDGDGLDIAIIDPATSPLRETFADQLFQQRQHRGMTCQKAQQQIILPLPFSAMMVDQGLADGSINGAMHTTADTVRAALQIIGVASNSSLVSSFFIMLLPENLPADKGMRRSKVIFSDCALIIDPSTDQLAQIALAAADNAARLIDLDPHIALLSFSTKGSARHQNVTKVANAARIVKQARPDLIVDGEMQFDAAFVPSVAAKKAPDSPIKGDANIFIFPNLEAGNIGYKIAQRIGGAKAIGPILQGLKKPANDLSRGCNAQDVYQMIAVTAVQAQMARQQVE